MNPETVLTPAVLRELGYKAKGRGKDRFFLKRRLVRDGTTRCSVQIKLHCDGNADVNAKETPVTPEGMTGFNSSKFLQNVKQIQEWESFAFGDHSTALATR